MRSTLVTTADRTIEVPNYGLIIVNQHSIDRPIWPQAARFRDWVRQSRPSWKVRRQAWADPAENQGRGTRTDNDRPENDVIISGPHICSGRDIRHSRRGKAATWKGQEPLLLKA
jgi:hypothetical protein